MKLLFLFPARVPSNRLTELTAVKHRAAQVHCVERTPVDETVLCDFLQDEAEGGQNLRSSLSEEDKDELE